MSPRIHEADRTRTTHPTTTHTAPKPKKAPPAKPAAAPESRPAPRPTEDARRHGRARHGADPHARQLRDRIIRNADGSRTFQAGSGDHDLVVRQGENGRVTIRDRTNHRTYTIDGVDQDHRLTIDAGAGNDRIEVRARGEGRSGILVRGGEGDDTIDASGSTRGVRIGGGAGDDRIRGGEGNDRLRGGAGDDRVRGGLGNDRLEGGSGDDQLRGGRGDDVIRGSAGEDRLFGGRGSDVIGGDEKDRRIDAGLDCARDIISLPTGGVSPTNTGRGDRIVAHDEVAVHDYLARHPNVHVAEDEHRELARLLATDRGRAQLGRVPDGATLHLDQDSRQAATRDALSRPGSHQVFVNSDGVLQDLSIRDEGDRAYRVRVRGLDAASAHHPTSFRAEFDRGVSPHRVLPVILDDYSESPHSLRESVRKMVFNSGKGPAIDSTDDPDDTAGANAANGVINYFEGTRNLGAFHHESAHLFGQDQAATGFVPPGYERAARKDGNFTSPYAEDSSSATGYTEDFADAWEGYMDAVDAGPKAFAEYREKYPNRVAWFEERYPRPY